MGIREDLGSKGFSVGKVNGLPNLSLPRWAYWRHKRGHVVFIPDDPVSHRRNINKGFTYLGLERPADYDPELAKPNLKQ